MRNILGWCGVLLIVAVSGCGSRYDDRIKAADNIQHIEDRSKALADIAEDAARAGDIRTVKNVIDKIQQIEIHDSTAEACAVHLAKAGQGAAAKEVAEKIQQLPVRDRALAKVARGGE